MTEDIQTTSSNVKQVTANPSNEKTTQGEQQESTIYKLLRLVFVNFAVIPAALTIAGFFVVHSYLGSFTNLFTYNISLTVYLAAGVNLVIGLLRLLFLPMINSVISASCIMVLVIIIGLWFVFWYSKRVEKKASSSVTNTQESTESTVRKTRFVMRVAWLLYRVIVYGGLCIAIISVSLDYGWRYYGKSDRSIGGGQPGYVILVFKDTEALAGLPLPINPQSPRQTEPIEYLMELNDGILVRHKPTNDVIIIRSDSLLAIVDAHRPINFVYPTNTPPAPSSTPIPSVTATPPMTLTP